MMVKLVMMVRMPHCQQLHFNHDNDDHVLMMIILLIIMFMIITMMIQSDHEVGDLYNDGDDGHDNAGDHTDDGDQ